MKLYKNITKVTQKRLLNATKSRSPSSANFSSLRVLESATPAIEYLKKNTFLDTSASFTSETNIIGEHNLYLF